MERFCIERAFRPDPTAEVPVLRAPFPTTAVDVYVDGRGDANWPVGNATVRIYALVGDVRVLVKEDATVTSAATRVSHSGGAATYECTIELGSGSELVGQAQFVMVGYGRRV